MKHQLRRRNRIRPQRAGTDGDIRDSATENVSIRRLSVIFRTTGRSTVLPEVFR